MNFKTCFGPAIALAVALAISGSISNAQTSQEAGIEPTNAVAPRDQAAIDDALHGWWTDALKNRDDRLEWWRDARFGCFIHWGVYSELGGEYNGRKGGSYSEHIMRQLKIPRQEYLEKVVAPFDPVKFDANQWVQLIKGAGMRYVVITAKHHDGFAMYPSDVTKYNIRDATHFGRDPMKELSDACHANGIRFGFYYSHAFDWEHPDAPGNDWDYKNPGGDLKLLGAENWYNEHPEVLERVKHYVDEKAIPQLQELVAKYHPDIFWFDTPQKLPPSEQIRIVKAVRAADPNVVVNGRAARVDKYNFGDYLDTADNPAEVRDPGGDWEAIPTVNSSYGYNKWDNNYKTSEFCIRLLAKIAAKGGNMLLNIGPKGDGTIDENATHILQGIGKWMDVNAESIRGTQRTPLDRQAWGDSTVKGNTLYLHVFQWPSDGRLVIAGLQTEITNAYLLQDPSKHPLQAARLSGNDMVIHIPLEVPDKTDAVIVAQLAGEPKAVKGRLIQPDVAENQLLAFDAATQGKFTFGDGKAARYYAAGFRKAGDALTWPIRTNDPGTYDVTVHYGTAKEGKVQVKVGDQTLSGDVQPGGKGIQTATLGQIKLPAIEAELQVNPISPDASLQIFDVTLTPAKQP